MNHSNYSFFLEKQFIHVFLLSFHGILCLLYILLVFTRDIISKQMCTKYEGNSRKEENILFSKLAMHH